MDLQRLTNISFRLGELLEEKKYLLTCAESCTGGWVSQSITSVAGSSKWFGTGFVTYSYESKCNILGVSLDDLNNYGAVSEEIVKQMVEGAISKSGANIGVAISGIAGPDGGTDSKPTGTVCFAWKINDTNTITSTELFYGNREKVRYHSVEKALLGTIEIIKNI